MKGLFREIKNFLSFQLLGEKMGYRLSVVNSRKRLLRGKDADGNNQVRHDLEPTDENYDAYVVPFVEAWEAHHLDYEKTVALQALS